jgi:hypothetical protein
MTIERLFLALEAKMGVRVRGVPVDIMVVIAASLTLMLLFQTKQIQPCDYMGGVDDVETVGNEAPAPGSLHHLIEQRLKALCPQAAPETAQGSEVSGQLLDAQVQEPLIDQVKSGLFFHLSIRLIMEKLQKHQLEHQHWVPGVSPLIGIEALAVLLDKTKIHHMNQSLQKVGL